MTLFLMAINGNLGELRNRVDFFCRPSSYIYITTRYQRVAARALQRFTNKLDAWLAKRRITFSTSKTIIMVFKKRRKRNKESVKITLKSQIVLNKKSTQFLGSTLDSRPYWEELIERVRANTKIIKHNQSCSRQKEGRRP